MRRVVIYGNGGSGKSTVSGALASALGAKAIEIDGIAFDGEYRHVEPTVLRARFESALASNRWVVEGMHRDELSVALKQADTFVWLDLPRRTIARRLIGRVLRQWITKRERHGQRTTLATLRRREVPFIRKTLRSHERRRQHGRKFVEEASSQGVAVIHLTAARKAKRWIRQVRTHS